jgi:hypothetical protein
VVNDNTIRRTFSLRYRIITSCCLIGTGLHLGDCKIAVIGSLFIRLISCWNTPQNAGNSLSELQEIKMFWGGCPQTPLDDLHLRCLTRLSQSRSNGPDPLPYDVYLLVKPCIYICWFLQVPREICSPQLHILKRGPTQILLSERILNITLNTNASKYNQIY